MKKNEKSTRRPLSRSFYARPAIIVAKELLGKHIVRKIGKKILIGKIIETEAYIGPNDKAAHSFGGKITARNQIIYEVGGYIYIYLVYGMYWQLNVVASKVGKPECVLIRALEPIENEDNLNFLELKKLTNGPGKLCRWLKLDKKFYGEDLTKSEKIWIEKSRLPKEKIKSTARIGIDYAGPYWSRRKLRFLLEKDFKKLKNKKYV